ncbi:MAG: response regulator [Bacteroidia bacterium]|nr:response regulator [Bacteroidia bacterium]
MENKIRILLIEDNPADARLIHEYLRQVTHQRYHLVTADTLKKGRETLLTTKTDIILLDLNLPDSMGFDTFENFYSEFPLYPIVVLTSQNDEKLGLRAVKSGAQDFVSKDDLTPKYLTRVIRYAIERTQLQRNLYQAQQLAKIGNWDINLDTNEMTCSPIIYEIFEKKQGEEFKTLQDYLVSVHPEDQEEVARKLKKVFEDGGSFEVDHRILFSDHRIKHAVFQGKTQTDNNNQPERLVGSVQDITERKQIEDLKQTNELNIRAIQLRQEFLAKTSHEIRTPLNPILLLTTILLDSSLSSTQREQLEAIKSAGETLLAVVNDILDLSKIEAGKIDFSHHGFNLRQVFDHVEDMMELSANGKGLKLIFNLDPRIPDRLVGDNVRLTQILLNLVGNAVKFTHKGEITIEAKLKKQTKEDAKIYFKVSDTGIGIPQDKLKVIFESFQQIENEDNRRQGGTGLGLTIVRQLVKLQGGNINVTSMVGVGSAFDFELRFDLTLQEEGPKQDVVIDKSKVAGIEILLVEDNPLNQMVTKKLLSDWGIDIQIANNGKECIENLRAKNYDLILMDVQMPEMNGYEATRYIREQMEPPLRDVPIIALTANAFTGSDDECLRVGMNDYLSKPIEIDTLYTKILQHARTGKRKLDAGKDFLYVNGNGTKISREEESQKTPENMPIKQHTDLSYLQQISGGDETIIRKTIEKFLETTPEMLEKMSLQLDEGAYEELGRTVHKLKSSVAFMGITSIKETILEVEKIIKTHSDFPLLPRLIGKIREVIEQSFAELEKSLPTH